MDDKDSENMYSQDYSDESDSDADLTWSPGDGVCPTAAEFNHCCQSKYDDWSHASSTSRDGFNALQSYLNAFLDLHRDIPPFFQSPPKGINITGERNAFLMLRSSLQVKTTQESDCSYPQKPIDYLQILGSPTPATYTVTRKTELQAILPVHTKPFPSGYFTTIVLAWSYIISCRWVEIFQQAGEKSEILHAKGMQIEDSFWDMITQGSWAAVIKKRKGRFFSPWMLTGQFVTKSWEDHVPVAPNPSLAFNIL